MKIQYSKILTFIIASLLLIGCSKSSENYDSIDLTESDISSIFYEHYENDDLSFDIPDGWYVDDSYGYPYFFVSDDENTDELMEIMPTKNFFPDAKENSTAIDLVTDYCDEEIDSGYFSDYEITESGVLTAKSFEAQYADVTAQYESYEPDRTRYILTDKNYLIILISLDTDESQEFVLSSYQDLCDTIEFK
ncbi:MAG: hypothetical protein LUI06_02125 [Ruminococcus sp.]|nr:hypothetical protein [Ruminococcus sp.]